MTEPTETTEARRIADEAADWRADVLTSEDTAEPEPSESADAEAETESAGVEEAPTDAAADATPAEAPDASEVEGEADTAEPEDADAPAAEARPDAKAQKSELQAFRIRVDGNDLDVPGAYTTPSGHVVMDGETFQRFIRPRLVYDRLALIRQARQEGAERALREQKLDDHPEIVRARQLLATFEDLKKRGVDGVAEWAEQFITNLPILEARTEAELWKRRASEYENGQRKASETAEREELAKTREASLRHYVEQALALPQLQSFGLDGERILRRLRHDVRTFAAAQRDHPEHGVRAGDPVVNLDVLHEVLEDEIARQPRAVAAVADADRKKIEANKAALGPKKKVAPVISQSGAGQGSAKKIEKEPETAEEWRDWVMNSK